LKNLIRKPYLFFFGLIPIFILIGFIKRDVPIDINISYIYYLINIDFWCYVSAVFFGLIGINYFSLHWAKKYPNKWLTILHILLQIISVLPYLYAIFKLDENGTLKSNTFLGLVDLENILILSFFLYLASIFIHLINFFSSLLLKRD
jgi:hypothetical protein